MVKSKELVDLAGKTQQWIERNFREAASTASEDTLIKGLTKSVAHFNALLHDEFFEKLQGHLSDLKGKSKVKQHTREVIELGAMIATKAKKIRNATWNDEILLKENDKAFTEILTAKTIDEKPRVNSAWESKLLFDAGNSIEGIASARGLAMSTIEGHIAQYVKTGDIDIKKVVSEEKIKVISDAFKELNVTGITPVKEKLGEGYSYGEIRMVFNHLEHLKLK